MKNRQEAVIYSPCSFTRSGLEGVLLDLHTALPVVRVGTLPAALWALQACESLTMLMLHVTSQVADEDWRRFDTVFSLWERPCHVVILVDDDCAPTLARMPTLCARANRIMNSAVPGRELMAYLEGLITANDLCRDKAP